LCSWRSRRRWRRLLLEDDTAAVAVTKRVDDGDGCYEEQASHEHYVPAAHP
jgi:hypothetical protein